MPCTHDAAEKTYAVNLPANHAAFLYGSVTAGYVQKVTATIKEDTPKAEANDEFVFEGLGQGLLVVKNTYKTTHTVTITPADQPRKIILKFTAKADQNPNFTDSKVTHKENEVPGYSEFHTFYTEDGFDSDNRDTDFVVSVLPTTKPGYGQ